MGKPYSVDLRLAVVRSIEAGYTREEAAYPLDYVRHAKFWPSVSRVNNTHGDRNLVCTCDSVRAYA